MRPHTHFVQHIIIILHVLGAGNVSWPLHPLPFLQHVQHLARVEARVGDFSR